MFVVYVVHMLCCSHVELMCVLSIPLCLRVVFMVGNVMWSVKGFLFHVECAV